MCPDCQGKKIWCEACQLREIFLDKIAPPKPEHDLRNFHRLSRDKVAQWMAQRMDELVMQTLGKK